MGTPLYASPEQCNEEAPDIRSDLYSLGVTLWYMLTGQPPFNGALGKVFAQHLSAPLPWDKLPADVPDTVRAVLGRMLAKERCERPQTPTDLHRELEACLRDQPAPSPTPAPLATPVLPAASVPGRWRTNGRAASGGTARGFPAVFGGALESR